MNFCVSPSSKKSFLVHIFIFFLFVLVTGRSAGDEENLAEEYMAGLDAYNKKHFGIAKGKFDELVQTYPNCAKCHHMRGKSYGRLAEESNWLKAVKYVPTTLKSFETAHRLAPGNIDILEDLIAFYSKAPFFLGGNLDMAKQLTIKLKKLRSNKTPVAPEKTL